MIRFGLVLVCLLGFQIARASSPVRELYTLRSQGSHYQVRVFRVEPGRLQELESVHDFASREAAAEYLRSRGLDERNAERTGGELQAAADGFAVTEERGQAVWAVRENWTPEWERRYAEWVTREVDAEFFSRNMIKTDCADVAISTRWIFARMNGLPAGNSLSATRALFTQDSMKSAWLKLPRHEDWRRDEVFRAALEYVMVNTDTHSLFSDSYPVAIDSETFLSGVYYMEFVSGESMGHTQLVNAVDLAQQSAEIRVLESTVPRDYRVLFAIAFDQVKQPKSAMGGLLRARWPEKKWGSWQLRKANQHPDYSVAQYAKDFVGADPGFSVAVKRRLASHYDPLRDFEIAIGNLHVVMRKRAGIVEEGFAVCRKTDCSPETKAWNDWSTPDRDGRLYDLALLLKNMRRDHPGDAGFDRLWSEFLTGRDLKIEGEEILNERLWIEIESNNLSPDPRDPIRKRWGLWRP